MVSNKYIRKLDRLVSYKKPQQEKSKTANSHKQEVNGLIQTIQFLNKTFDGYVPMIYIYI